MYTFSVPYLSQILDFPASKIRSPDITNRARFFKVRDRFLEILDRSEISHFAHFFGRFLHIFELLCPAHFLNFLPRYRHQNAWLRNLISQVRNSRYSGKFWRSSCLWKCWPKSVKNYKKYKFEIIPNYKKFQNHFKNLNCIFLHKFPRNPSNPRTWHPSWWAELPLSRRKFFKIPHVRGWGWSSLSKNSLKIFYQKIKKFNFRWVILM